MEQVIELLHEQLTRAEGGRLELHMARNEAINTELELTDDLRQQEAYVRELIAAIAALEQYVGSPPARVKGANPTPRRGAADDQP